MTTKNYKIKKQAKFKLVSGLLDVQQNTLSNWESPHDNDKRVNWDKTTDWKVTTEGARGYVILRYVRFRDNSNMSKERLDREIYQSFSDNQAKCEEICRILNYRVESRRTAKDAWLIKSSFLGVQGSELSIKFEEYLRNQSGNPDHAKKCRRMVEMHFLDYVFNLCKPALYDYLEWNSFKVQNDFIEHLYTKQIQSSRMGKRKNYLASKTIIAICQYTNVFMTFLHVESKNTIPLLQFTFPNLNQARLLKHSEKRRKLLPPSEKKSSSDEYIDEDTYKLIYESAPYELKSAIWIAYNFGLRRSEVLGLELDCTKKGHLYVYEQLKNLEITRNSDGTRKEIISKGKDLLKNKKVEGRKIPYWFADRVQAYEHIQKLHVVYPSGLTKMWGEFMDKLGYNYEFKSLRNAFCSNALRDMNKLNISAADVQWALGHEDIRTTMIYLRDFRMLDDDETWVPDSVG